MFRMTLVLLAGLFAAMSIWGSPPADDVTVARAETLAPTIGRIRAPARPAKATSDERKAISDREALELALAAGAERDTEVVQVAATTVEPEATEEEAGRIRYVTGNRVNLRDGPTTNSAIVGSLVQGDRTQLLSEPSDSWVRIRTDAGIEAWIFGRFLSETPA